MFMFTYDHLAGRENVMKGLQKLPFKLITQSKDSTLDISLYSWLLTDGTAAACNHNVA